MRLALYIARRFVFGFRNVREGSFKSWFVIGVRKTFFFVLITVTSKIFINGSINYTDNIGLCLLHSLLMVTGYTSKWRDFGSSTIKRSFETAA